MNARSNASAGFTLVEVLIAAILVSVLFAALSMTMKGGSAAYHQGVSNTTAESQARRGLDRIVAELGDAESTTMLPQPVGPLGSATLTFHRSTGAAGGAITWGADRTIQFQYEAAEADDGIDNDGDGLIDEGRVVLIENAGLPNATTQVLCPNVREYLEGEVPNGVDDNGNGLIDEQGLSFELVGGTLRVRLTVERTNEVGSRVLRTVETSVWVHN